MARITLKEQLETRLGDSFRDIIIKNIPLGTGRYEAAKILDELCEKHRGPDEPKMKVLHSTLWYAVHKAIEETGELCEVDGDIDTNPLFYFNHGKHKHVTRPKPVQENLELDLTCTCTKCNLQWYEHKKIKSLDMLCVRSKQCPQCAKHGVNTFGNIIVKFEHEGQTAIKAVATIDSKLRETFVTSLLEPCESPFEKVTVTA